MRILDIMHDSIVDGVGLRAVIFFAGCPHRCKGCHNPQSWNIGYGKEYTIDDVVEEIKSNKAIQGITFSGGDPFFQAKEILELAKEIKQNEYNLWAYTGFTFEEIIKDNVKLELLKQIDVLVDGRFVEELKDLTLRFRGSSNQRIIDVQKSIQENKIILYMN